MMYKVPPGDISANNYGRGHMKPSHQVSYDMRLPPYKKIPVKMTSIFRVLLVYDYFSEFASEALHIVIFEIFVKSMTSCLSKLKVTPSFCFAFKIPDDVTASNMYISNLEDNFYKTHQHVSIHQHKVHTP